MLTVRASCRPQREIQQAPPKANTCGFFQCTDNVFVTPTGKIVSQSREAFDHMVSAEHHADVFGLKLHGTHLVISAVSHLESQV